MSGPVVITGAGGLLGGQTAWTFAQAKHDVYAFTHKQLDITDADAVRERIEAIKPSLVVHCAAMTNVDACEEQPDLAYAVNAAGSANVASAAADVGAAVVAVSTDYVFDGTGAPYGEADATSPIQVYGQSKLAGEESVRGYNDRHFIVRSAWIYGPGGKNHISKLPEYAKTGGSVSAVTDQRSSPTYAPDLADAIVLLGSSDRYGTYHVVNTGSCTFAEFFDAGVDLLDSNLEVLHITLAELGRPAPRPVDTTLVGDAWHAAGFPTLRHWRDAARSFLTSVATA